MTRSINQKSMEQAQRIEEALEGVKSGRFKDKLEAAKQLGIPPSTLYHRAAGRPTRSEAHESEQILSAAEETELVQWIRRLTASGYPPKHNLVRDMAEAIRTQRVNGINDESVTNVSYEAIGEQWVRRFINRHPDLESVIATPIEAARVTESTYEVLEKFFQDVKSIIE